MPTQTIILYVLAAALFILAGYQMKTISALHASRSYFRRQIELIDRLRSNWSHADD